MTSSEALSTSSSSVTLNEMGSVEGFEGKDDLLETAIPGLKSVHVRKGKRELIKGRELKFKNGYRVRFSPVNVPLQRRLETAAVLWHSFTMITFLSLFWFMLAVPIFWPILAPYFLFTWFSTSPYDGRSPYVRSTRFRRLPMWRYFKSYFPITLHRSSELDPSKNYIFGYHPHGVISHGAFGTFVLEDDHEGGQWGKLFPGIKNTLLTLESNFRIPFYREYLISLGLASVSKASCEALLRGSYLTKQQVSFFFQLLTFPLRLLGILKAPAPKPAPGGGRAISIVLGGAAESLHAIPGTMNLIIKKRKGFVKLALKEGAQLVPVLSFGENDLYDLTVPESGSWISAWQQLVKKFFGYTFPLFHARGVFNYDVGILPYRREVNVVVGRPIGFDEKRAGTNEEIEELHRLYCEELQRLWDTYKDVFATHRKAGEAGELHFME